MKTRKISHTGNDVLAIGSAVNIAEDLGGRHSRIETPAYSATVAGYHYDGIPHTVDSPIADRVLAEYIVIAPNGHRDPAPVRLVTAQ